MAGISDNDKAWLDSFLGKDSDEEFKQNVETAAKQMKIMFDSFIAQGFSRMEALTIIDSDAFLDMPMSRRRWRQRRKPKWIDKDPRKQGWCITRLTADSRVYVNRTGKVFYERW